MIVVIKDRWIPDKYFENNEQVKANDYVRWCNYAYQGSFEVRRCSDDYPLRFEKVYNATSGNCHRGREE